MLSKLLELKANYNPKKSAVIFDEATKFITNFQEKKIDKEFSEYLSENILIIQSLYYSLSMNIVQKEIKLIGFSPEIMLTLTHIVAEIIDILQTLVYSIEYWQHMISYSLLRMLKERVLYSCIIGEKRDNFCAKCKRYYDFYQNFISEHVKTDLVNQSEIKKSKEYYRWQDFYPKKMSITKLMKLFDLGSYSFDSYNQHGWYGTRMDCNMLRNMAEVEPGYKWSSKKLIYEVYWKVWSDVISVTLNCFTKMENFLWADYFKETVELLYSMNRLWIKSYWNKEGNL